MKRQDDIFLKEDEGDAWYVRNAPRLQQEGDSSVLSRYVSRLSLKKKSVLEVGCSNGYLLAPLARRGARCFGLDPSARAIQEGRHLFPLLKLDRGVSHDLSCFKNDYFDIVIISYVLHWVDRSRLMQTIAEIDRVLKTGGLLIIQDFDPDAPHKTRYKHRTDRRVYTYKQPYADIFLSSAGYTELKRMRFLHGDYATARPHLRKGSNSCSVVVLRKDGEANYPERILV